MYTSCWRSFYHAADFGLSLRHLFLVQKQLHSSILPQHLLMTA